MRDERRAPQLPMPAEPDRVPEPAGWAGFSGAAAHRPEHGGDAGGWNLLVKIWRRKWLVLGITALAGAAAVAAVASMPQRYTAEARIRIGLQQPEIAEKYYPFEQATPNSDAVRTEAYVIGSREMAGRVARRLRLDTSPVFNPALRQEPSWVERLGLGDAVDAARQAVTATIAARGAATPPAPALSDEERRDALWERIEMRLLGRMTVEPLSRSRIISIAVETEEPRLSADIANAIATEYAGQTLAAKEAGTNRARDWLDTRLEDLRSNVEEAERKVEEYRDRHKLYATRSDTVVGQRMAALNQTQVEARNSLAGSESRLLQAEGLRTAGGDLKSMPAALQSPLILSLRDRRAELQTRAADLAARYTSSHPSMRAMRQQVAEIDGEIDRELGRLIEGLEHDVAIDRANLQQVTGRMAEVESEMGDSNAAAVRLHQLEREAATSRALYEAVLLQSKETSYIADLMTPEAELLSRAAIPLAPSYPPGKLIVVVATMAAFGAAILLVLLIERLDQTFRTPEDVEEHLGLPVLAVLPRVARSYSGRCDHVLRHGDSAFTDAVRMLGAQLDLEGRSGVIPGVTIFASAIASEGKSHTSCSFAQAMAAEGKSVVLVDMDWRQPTQHRLFGLPFRRAGIAELMAGEVALEDVIRRDRKSGVDLLFGSRLQRRRGDTVSLAQTRALLEMLATRYDRVVVDTSPLHAAPEVLHLARLADRVVICTKWGATKRQALVGEAKHLVRAGVHISGVVLTQVEPRRYRRYSYGHGDYLHRGYLAHG